MKKVVIYEPAMCCSTGVCGVDVNPELIRITSIIRKLDEKGIKLYRYNLTNDPLEFVNNEKVSNELKQNGVINLPLVFVDDVLVATKRYPTNDELLSIYGLESLDISDCCDKSDSFCSNDVNCCEPKNEETFCSSKSKCCCE